MDRSFEDASLLPAAVHNNAVWCDAVCRAHGLPTAWAAALWRCPAPAPRYYPNAVTLRADAQDAQQAQIAALVRGLPGGWAVKDSYAALDLTALGFEVLFAATWVGRTSAPLVPPDPALDWRTVRRAADLAAWEAAWAGDDPAPARTFPPALLDDADVTLLVAQRAGRTVGGAILNRSAAQGGAAVIGLSNIFAVDPADAPALWVGAAAEAARRAPGLALVGYEAGSALEWAQAAGFAALGPLRIWGRAA